MTTLDSFAEGTHLPDIDVLKIDIEGAELPAILGARRLLEHRRIRSLILEVHGAIVGADGATAVCRELIGLDYEGFLIDERHWRRGLTSIQDLLVPLSMKEHVGATNFHVLWRPRQAPAS